MKIISPMPTLFFSGLSGSSGIVCAALNCFLDFYKVRDLITVEVRTNLNLAVEEELGIVAGLQDRVAQVYGGLVYMDFSKESMDKLGYGSYIPMDLILLPPLYLIYAPNLSDSGKKPGGMIALLDEACMFPKSTHETFSQKRYQTFKDHKRFIKPKLARSDFTIVHYAGEVKYQSEHFIDKNKDYVVPEHQDMLSTSKCSFVSGLFPPLSEETAKSAKFFSIGSRFKVDTVVLIRAATITTIDGDPQSDRAPLYQMCDECE